MQEKVKQYNEGAKSPTRYWLWRLYTLMAKPFLTIHKLAGHKREGIQAA
jgi:hypothetical protein